MSRTLLNSKTARRVIRSAAPWLALTAAFIFPPAVCRVTAAPSSPPHLQAQGTATQLIVDGRAFLIRGGEIGNSSASNPATFEQHWAKLKSLNLNTVLVPVYWHLIEPQEGRFDFATVDELLRQAREHKMRLVLLWFGSWKNSMSCYAPDWMKLDSKCFPRAADRKGQPQEILSPFSPENCDRDVAAFAALMRHLKEVDGQQHTVIMVQVENEIGMLPTPRDHSPAAENAFNQPVPDELRRFLAVHANELHPQLKYAWSAAGGRSAGKWTDVFGESAAGEEIFMAWHFARSTEAVTEAGKKAYTLPMFVNAALIRPGHQPGQYPSAGPLPHLIDVWRAAAPGIDFVSPDIYFQNFIDWARRYHVPGNPLFIP